MEILKIYEYNNERTKRKIAVYTNGQVIDCRYYREEKMAEAFAEEKKVKSKKEN